MHPNAELVQRFYEAFHRHDAEAMVAAYAPDVVFTDPVFGRLEGARAGGMWRMLTSRAKDLTVQASGIEADDTSGKAHWVADYTFSTGRKVHNEIDAVFTFRDGRIVEHTDTFDLAKWCRMALPGGWLIGAIPPLRASVGKKAQGQLDRWMERQGASAG